MHSQFWEEFVKMRAFIKPSKLASVIYLLTIKKTDLASEEIKDDALEAAENVVENVAETAAEAVVEATETAAEAIVEETSAEDVVEPIIDNADEDIALVADKELEAKEETEEVEVDDKAINEELEQVKEKEFNWNIDRRGANLYSDEQIKELEEFYDGTFNQISEFEIIDGTVNCNH